MFMSFIMHTVTFCVLGVCLSALICAIQNKLYKKGRTNNENFAMGMQLFVSYTLANVIIAIVYAMLLVSIASC